jgi:hypothetical protein
MASEPLSPLLERKKLVKLIEETTAGTMETSPTLLPENIYDVKCEPGDFFSEGERMPDGNYLGPRRQRAGRPEREPPRSSLMCGRAAPT